jgi:hypothetical protein
VEGSIYGWWAFVRVMKLAFGNMVWGLFRWLFAVNSVSMWNLSIVLSELLFCGSVLFAYCS